MKKVLAIVLSLVLVLSLATAAFAASVNQITEYVDVTTTPGANTGIAWFEMDVAYVVSYPDEIEVNGAAANLTISGAYVEYDHSVSVAVSSADWKLEYQDDTCDYTLVDGEANEKDAIVLTYEPDNTDNHSISTTLTATAVETGFGYAGMYTDTLTYTIAYNEPTP